MVYSAIERDAIARSACAVASWVEAHHYRGYDPGDGLNSFLRPLALGNRLVERVLLQAVWKSPFNLRPLLGIKPMDSTKGRGYMAWGYLLRYRKGRDPLDLEKALTCLQWLMQNRAAGHEGYSWGNHFDFVTRSGCNPAGSPIIVWTSLIGQAFLEAFEQTADSQYLEVALGICEWILRLPRERTLGGDCLSYVPFAQSSIHNSNMLGASMLASTWKHARRDELIEVASSAMQYTCSRQLHDGSWWYGEDSKYHWIDNFHTGYNLDSLKRFLDSGGDDSYRTHYRKGLDYYKHTFIEADGTPRYYSNRTQPIDIQAAAQTIETLAFCAEDDPGCLDLSKRVAAWTIANMQDSDGHFWFRKYPVLTAKTAYIHWGQSTMFKALTTLLDKYGDSDRA
jgi:rhamnogalacturonyl hydrolase YesR